MNYFNPYYYYPVATTIPRASLFSNLFRGINFSSILSGTSKTLNVVNQAIPIVKQAGPIMKNAKTMFKVMNEFKKVDIKDNAVNTTLEATSLENKKIGTGPTFFV